MLITNHTFANLVLRAPGMASVGTTSDGHDRPPVADEHDHAVALSRALSSAIVCRGRSTTSP